MPSIDTPQPLNSKKLVLTASAILALLLFLVIFSSLKQSRLSEQSQTLPEQTTPAPQPAELLQKLKNNLANLKLQLHTLEQEKERMKYLQKIR